MRNLTDPNNNNNNGQRLPHPNPQEQNPFSETHSIDSDAYSLQSDSYNNHSPSQYQRLNSRPQSPFIPQQHLSSSQHLNDTYVDHSAAQSLYPPYASDSHLPMMRDYGGVSTNASSSNLPIPGSRLSSSGSSEFDRYPPSNRQSTAAPSFASAPLIRGPGPHGGLSPSPGPFEYGYPNSTQRGSIISDETASDTSGEQGPGNPFLVNADFSPFGGYPASSFPLHLEEKEDDDYLHNPDPILDAKFDRRCQGLDKRGWASFFAFACLFVGGACLFIILPVLTYTGVSGRTPAQLQTVEILTNYTYGTLGAIRTNLVDPDTPASAQTHTAKDGSQWNLVFSDEFNKEGRTFYSGDDQFWTGPDFHYASTDDLEWYTPDAMTTSEGALVIRMDAFQNHNLFYRSGMLQSWNQFCFTQGYIEVGLQLPGSGAVSGQWPGVWTLGNLARPGFEATSDGVWPYGYQSCDAGITANQSSADGISFLPGQRLNSCTCPGHDHPNTGTGRGAPEIDIIEGAIGTGNGVASQSLQVAPFDVWYMPDYDFLEVHNRSITAMNPYAGGPFQEAVSGTTMLNVDWYQEGGSFQQYGFEYLNDNTNGYISWFVGPNPSWTLLAPALGPNGNVNQRVISKEPMSIVLNSGLSNSWAYIDWPQLLFPNFMRVDYVRVYQPSDQVSTTCDPSDYPTYNYIQEHLNAYMDPNLTSWAQAGYAFPPTQLLNEC